MRRLAIIVLAFALSAAMPPPVAAGSTVRRVLDPVAANTPRTEVLVLGTPHLADLDPFDPKLVAPLIDVLVRFQPTIICVEAMPGEDLARMEEAGGQRAEIAAMFAATPMKLGRELRMEKAITTAAASRRVHDALGAGAMTPEERAALVVNLMAAYEFPSAVLQWSLVDLDFRRDTSLVPPAVKAWLDSRLASANEIYSVAVPLARRLGLQTLAPVDSQDGAAKLLTLPDAQVEELFGHPLQKKVAKAPVYARTAAMKAAALEQGDLLPYYLHLNSEAWLAGDIDAQWSWYWQSKLPSGADRLRYSLWELRNIEIATAVAQQTASVRNERVLLLIGSAHKRFVEEILGRLVHVRLVELDQIALNAER